MIFPIYHSEAGVSSPSMQTDRARGRPGTVGNTDDLATTRFSGFSRLQLEELQGTVRRHRDFCDTDKTFVRLLATMQQVTGQGPGQMSPLAMAASARIALMRAAVSGDEAHGFPERAALVSAGGALIPGLPVQPAIQRRAAGYQPPPKEVSVTVLAREAGKRYDVAPELVTAVIRAESGFDHRAVSHAGACGLMQLMPETAQELGVRDPFDPEENVMAGTRHLKRLLEKYGNDPDRALAAYNWGEGNVDRKGMDRLPRETRTYLARIKGFLGEAADGSKG